MRAEKEAKPFEGSGAGADNDRLYQRLARRLFDELGAGRYAVGDRLPAERELAVDYGVSRPAVREAIIALEVQGLVEVRVGSGAYVRRLPRDEVQPGFEITAFEVTEARMLFEGEAAALAATHIGAEELAELDRLVDRMTDRKALYRETEEADEAFHLLIARATHNKAIAAAIEEFWRLRRTSPACALLHEKARDADVRPVREEHGAIVEALRARDPAAARAAMRAHLTAVLEHLLFTTEEQAIEAARTATARTRQRYARTASI